MKLFSIDFKMNVNPFQNICNLNLKVKNNADKIFQNIFA